MNRMRDRALVASRLGLVWALGLAGAAQVQAQAPFQAPGQASPAGVAVVAAAPRPLPTAAPSPEYRLSGGDIIRISVFQSPELTLETRVSESGHVSYPLLGSVRLGGLSAAEAEKTLAEGLARGNFVRSPQVTVAVLQVRGNQANVLGQVNRPGRYPLETADLRLTDLLALAGGVAAGGADTVVLSGQREGQPFRRVIDLPALFAEGAQREDLFIRHGDVVWVDRQPLVYIYGEAQRPGPMRLERGMTVRQALAAGGGPTVRGTQRGLRLHRRAADGRTELISPELDDQVQEGDVIYVRESLF